MAISEDKNGEKLTNFAVPPLTYANKEYFESIMELYTQPNDKKADTLVRIMQVAEHNQVKGLHPELEPCLNAIDSTIGTLIKQINGIVSGQDSRIHELESKLEEAIAAKADAIEQAKAREDAAAARSAEADVAIEQAKAEINAAKAQAEGEVNAAKTQAEDAIRVASEKAVKEIEQSASQRDQAIRERDDARAISAEKTASNDLLMRQMAAMEADVQAHKVLQDKYETLREDYAALSGKAKEDAVAAEQALREAQASAEDAKKIAVRDLEEVRKESDYKIQSLTEKLDVATQNAMDAKTFANKIADENKDLLRQISELKQQAAKASGEAEVFKEKAVIAREREIRAEYQAQIRQTDKENARMAFEIDQLKARIAQFEAEERKRENQ